MAKRSSDGGGSNTLCMTYTMLLGSFICFASFRFRDAPGIVVPIRWLTARKPALFPGSRRRIRSAQIIPSKTPKPNARLTITEAFCTAGASRRRGSRLHGPATAKGDRGSVLQKRHTRRRVPRCPNRRTWPRTWGISLFLPMNYENLTAFGRSHADFLPFSSGNSVYCHRKQI